jgi:hypothetical protein
MAPRLRNDEQSLEAVLLYLKLGGEKLARVAIDAYNQTYRLQAVAEQKLRLEETLLAKQMAEEEEQEEDEDDEDDDEGDDKNEEEDEADY